MSHDCALGSAMGILFASEASSVTNCANLRFLVYMYVAVRPIWSRTGPP